ncbi:MAG: hypothetical protein ACWA40_03370 [Planktomarina sp.]
MRVWAALVLALWSTCVAAQVDGVCYVADQAKGGCVDGPVRDADGILRPGLHVLFEAPTARYGHGVLGDAIEWGALTVLMQGSAQHGPYMMRTYTLPQTRVFEDIAPRVIDLDGDGILEIIVVESHVDTGAQLAIYRYDAGQDDLVKVTATPHIGRTNRWLAPIGIGAAELTGGGNLELAYIDRPHLAKRLRVWRFVDDTLVHLADMDGFTNHRIGENFISGGVRDCGTGAELVVANATWSKVMGVRYVQGQLQARVLTDYQGPSSFEAALACKR